MEYRQFGDKLIVRLERGEEVVDVLTHFCRERQIKLGTVEGIGAAKRVTVGLFSTVEKEYCSREFTGDYELCSVNGNISTQDGEPYLHLHVTIAGADHQALGGHLNSAVISGTGEFAITVIDGEIGRQYDSEVGLNLLQLT